MGFKFQNNVTGEHHMLKPKIRVRDLELFYGQNQALKGIDMDILPNTVTAFIRWNRLQRKMPVRSST